MGEKPDSLPSTSYSDLRFFLSAPRAMQQSFYRLYRSSVFFFWVTECSFGDFFPPGFVVILDFSRSPPFLSAYDVCRVYCDRRCRVARVWVLQLAVFPDIVVESSFLYIISHLPSPEYFFLLLPAHVHLRQLRGPPLPITNRLPHITTATSGKVFCTIMHFSSSIPLRELTGLSFHC